MVKHTMKKIFIPTILVFLFYMNINCSKDELETNNNQTTKEQTNLPSTVVENRSISNIQSLIFYRTSLTTDNYLFGTSTPRTHVIYNKYKVKDINFRSSGQGLANIGNVLCKHYNIQINFTDGTKETITAYSKNNSDVFTFVPLNPNLLVDSHKGKKISLISTNTSTYTVPQYYNFWRNTYQSWTIWKIYVDNQFTQQRYLESLDKNNTQFSPPHAH